MLALFYLISIFILVPKITYISNKGKKNSRLSCQIIISDELDGLEVTTPEKQS